MGGTRGKIVTSNINMRFVLMSLAGALLVSLRVEATMQLMEKMVNEVNTHRLKAECFGEVNKNMYDKAIEGAMEKCMQLAPAFNLANIIADSRNSLKEPFKQLQFTNLDSIVSLWRTKRDTGL